MIKPPFVNLFDIAGLTMISLFFFVFLALAGSRLVTWDVVLVVAVVFAAAIFFAKRGAP